MMDNYTEKLKRYNEAKDAYYLGEEIMSDDEFDELENELGFENKGHIGTRHNPSYTIQHPFIMGSLSKVQIHEDHNTHTVDWKKYLSDARSYFGENKVIITPKYDGCSFEIYYNNGHVTCSTRGDGQYGRDISHIIQHIVPESLIDDISNFYNKFTLRGEVLMDYDTFEKRYQEFVNPRSVVSGLLNRDADEIDLNTIKDLSVVIYDFRYCHHDATWIDCDWTELNCAETYAEIFPDYDFEDYDLTNLEFVYNKFNEYRKGTKFALDGFVIKPMAKYRINNVSEPRPSDCVAIKFIPMLNETEVVNITWNLGKTNEYIPIIWVKPVTMDGKIVQKCSGHNYGLLVQRGVGIGSKIIMSLAGDIIPFLYRVTESHIPINIPMPDGEYYIDGVHLMAKLSDVDKKRNMFVNSVISLNIPNLGGEIANKIFDNIIMRDETDEFFGESRTNDNIPSNVLELTPEQLFFNIKNLSKSGSERNARKIMNDFKKILENLTLQDIVKSFNFRFCGAKVTEQVVRYLLGENYDFASMAREGYEWAMNENSEQYIEMIELLNKLGRNLDDFKDVSIINNDDEKIPVILTGEPNNYHSKGEFINHHPEYRITGSWREVKIVFTNDLNSNTGKMRKAREKGIEIRVY